jgi:hypothetical protein
MVNYLKTFFYSFEKQKQMKKKNPPLLLELHSIGTQKNLPTKVSKHQKRSRMPTDSKETRIILENFHFF